MKNTFVFLVLVACHSFAADKGIHITFDINSDTGDSAAIGTTDYYFQNGNLRAEINMEQGTVDKITMIENNGRLYTLFPDDKTYMEIPQFVAGAAANLGREENPGDFKSTKQKKKIAGYECEIFKKEDAQSMDTVCINQPLYNRYKDLFFKIKKMMGNQNSFVNIEGFPLEAISTGKGKEKTKTTILVTKIDEQNFTGKFDLPKNYTEKNMVSGAVEMLKKLQSGENATPGK
jgi:hypothetical protein